MGAYVTVVCDTNSVQVVRDLGADRITDHTADDFTKDDQRYDEQRARRGFSTS
jgi:NADPH:quinone reductase-like Zn-dependent oxidoreductase